MSQSSNGKIHEALQALNALHLVDLSHEMVAGMPVWPTLPGFQRRRVVNMKDGGVCNSDELTLTDHCGTHVDAPGHYRAQGPWISEIPIDAFWGRGIVLRPEASQAGDAVGPSAVHAWENQHGQIRDGDIVFFDLGWSHLWAAPELLPDVVAGWPGLRQDTAEILRDRKVKAVGVDTLSVDSSSSTNDAAHRVLLDADITIAENLAHLDGLPPVFLTALFPWKIHGGSASPVRAVAWIER
jgi:arylformamidase